MALYPPEHRPRRLGLRLMNGGFQDLLNDGDQPVEHYRLAHRLTTPYREKVFFVRGMLLCVALMIKIRVCKSTSILQNNPNQ